MMTESVEQFASLEGIFTGIATNDDADAETPADSGIYLIYGASGFFESSNKVDSTLTIFFDPDGVNTIVAGILIPNPPQSEAGKLFFPRSLLIHLSGTQIIRARLSAGGPSVIGHVALYTKKLE